MLFADQFSYPEENKYLSEEEKIKLKIRKRIIEDLKIKGLYVLNISLICLLIYVYYNR